MVPPTANPRHPDMTPFKFPPPPPPPPKATAPPHDASEYASSQRGGLGNFRGRGLSRGRGQGHGGGRGNNFRGNSGSGHGHNEGRNAQATGGWRSGQHSNGQDYQNYGQHQSFDPQSSATPNSSFGPYVNPLWTSQVQMAQPQINPAAFGQALTMPTTAALANHPPNGAPAPQMPQSPPPQKYLQQHSPPQQIHGRKRKRTERATNWRAESVANPAQNSQLPAQKPQKAKAAVAPSVPSFGFILPTPKKSPVAGSPKAKPWPDLNKRKVHLGLTAQNKLEPESSSDEEVDEEAVFAAKITGMVFEHDGQTISLQTPAELVAWRKDRKKHYPTRTRIEEKTREAAERRASELEFLRRIKKGTTNKTEGNHHGSDVVEPPPTREQKSSEKHTYDFGELQRNLGEQILEDVLTKPAILLPELAGNKPKTADLGPGYTSETEPKEETSSEFEESSVVSSLEGSSDGLDSDDSDAAPEEQSSKTVIAPTVVPLEPAKFGRPLRKKDHSTECVQWKRYGKCNYGNQCKWPHPPKVEKKAGLFETLVEQEKRQADQLALDAIKYLGRHGFLG
ncbi:uncharacterized protein BDR25DRAFT_380092 [Lindgomyces ingoldianus]|uniref:Uncharacterized protein n=1 Tax=Lindgomyces ingoldianus TaxID=673940 RepID=A0ACB6QDN5_9PLEO|nr:uncharacterized protein BDR25DRAFT_380092 [Lindgomyces ingoldianus]KAF2465024.1 hypothetical protein BDR25DRAFT_380092 [Lindgomyces ingoldianus]